MNTTPTKMQTETAHGPPEDRRDAARLAFLEALGELEDRTRDVLGEIGRLRLAAADGAEGRRLSRARGIWLDWRQDFSGPTSAAYTAARRRVSQALGTWVAACREWDGRWREEAP